MHNIGSNNFAHGAYGDDSGLVFSGPPVNGFRNDRLAVSDRFIGPLFGAILDRALRDHAGVRPRVVAEWQETEGWAGAGESLELPQVDAKEIVAALAGLTESDVISHVVGVTPEECVRCGAAIAEYIHDRIARGQRV